MGERKETLKKVFTVEGNTEKLYLKWLEGCINNCSDSFYKVSFKVDVEQNPSKYVKKVSHITAPEVTHLCDIESEESEYINRFNEVISQVATANRSGKHIKYDLKYSNLTFELWMILHKIDCYQPISSRDQYIKYINKGYNENFPSLRSFKEEKNFNKCLSKLTLDDVIEAVNRSKRIMNSKSNDPSFTLNTYKNIQYYKENPSLTIWEIIEEILSKCWIL